MLLSEECKSCLVILPNPRVIALGVYIYIHTTSLTYSSFSFVHRQRSGWCYLSNGLFFFSKKCSLITLTVCAFKLNNALYENLFAHTVAVLRLHLSEKKRNPLLIFTF